MNRIECITSMIQPCTVLADIGSDHGLLPVLAVQKGLAQKAYACDIAKGPLESAAKNIEQYGLQQHISTILSNGFEHVPKDIQCAVIAGMGCKTAIGILEQGEGHISSLEQILVEVNNDVEQFRYWLSSKHYTIMEEKVIEDRGHGYICISFSPLYHEEYTPQQCVLGPCLMEHPDTYYLQYCRHRAEKLAFILSKRKDDSEETLELQKRYHWYLEVSQQEQDA